VHYSENTLQALLIKDILYLGVLMDKRIFFLALMISILIVASVLNLQNEARMKNGLIYHFQVSGLGCKSCSNDLMEAIFSLNDISDVDFHWADKKLFIANSNPKETTKKEIRKAIRNAISGVHIWLNDEKVINSKQCHKVFSNQTGLHRSQDIRNCSRYLLNSVL
jgi:hypothetical protein